MQHVSHRSSDDIAQLNLEMAHLKDLLRQAKNVVAEAGAVELWGEIHEALKGPWKQPIPEGEPQEVDGSAWDRLPPAPKAQT